MSAVTQLPPPVDPAEAEALDAYSHAVIAVAERVGPSVASLRVMRRVRGGQVPSGAGSAVALSPDGYLLTAPPSPTATTNASRSSAATRSPT
jgi:hypothetical protein